MTSSKFSELPSTPYDPLPTYPRQQPQYIIVLPQYYRTPRQLLRRPCRRYVYCAAVFILLSAALFFLWPSDPELSIARLHLRHLKVHSFPKIAIDVTLDVTAKIRNKDFYSVSFRSVVISVGYRGKQLGHVISDYGRIKARASSYVNATLELTDVSIFSDIIPLIEDLARGSITFDTVTQIGGELGLVLFDIPIKGKVSCEIVVDTRNETITHQNCYPEAFNVEGEQLKNFWTLNTTQNIKFGLLHKFTNEDDEHNYLLKSFCIISSGPSPYTEH